jgi:plasmid stability protein
MYSTWWRLFDSKLGSWEAGFMKTTLDLPDELIREVKLRAVVQGRTVKDLVAEFLRQGMGMAPLHGSEQRAGSPMVKIGKNGLPVIQCTAEAPATHMSALELLALEHKTHAEEDLKRAGLPL